MIQNVPLFAGSGELAAVSTLERGWQSDLSLDEAVHLAARAASAGVENDLGSGSSVDVCVIAVDETAHTENPENHMSTALSGTTTTPFPGTRVWYLRGFRPEEQVSASGPEWERTLLEQAPAYTSKPAPGVPAHVKCIKKRKFGPIPELEQGKEQKPSVVLGCEGAA